MPLTNSSVVLVIASFDTLKNLMKLIKSKIKRTKGKVYVRYLTFAKENILRLVALYATN